MHTSRYYNNHRANKRRRWAAATACLLLIFAVGILLQRFRSYIRTDAPSVTQVQGAKTSLSDSRKETIVETEMIPYGIKTVDDATKFVGSSTVVSPGAYGIRRLTYEISYIDDSPQPRKLVSDEVTVQPVEKIVSVGTKQSGDPE